jgi:membrane fusion protein, multidrug efflux system
MKKTLLMVLAIPILGAACARGAAHEVANVPAIPVRVAPVTRSAVSLPIVGTGTLGAKDEIQLSFKVGGVIDRVTVDPGESVRAGQLLAELRLDEADATVSRAGAAYDNAARELTRAQRLYADSVVTLAQLQGAEAIAQATLADLATARFNQRYARIVAPSSGVILERKHEPGELVSPGAPVLALASRSRGNVFRVGLADRDVVRVRQGDRATVRFDAIPGKTFAGSVSQVGAAAQAGIGTYLVDIRLRDANGLVSDLVGSAEIFPARQGVATLVPLDALLEADGDRGTVYVLSADRRSAERRDVTIAFLAGDQVAVGRGLDSTDKVITRGAAYLRHGSAVEVIP